MNEPKKIPWHSSRHTHILLTTKGTESHTERQQRGHRHGWVNRDRDIWKHKDLKIKRIDIRACRHTKRGVGSQSDSISDINPEKQMPTCWASVSPFWGAVPVTNKEAERQKWGHPGTGTQWLMWRQWDITAYKWKDRDSQRSRHRSRGVKTHRDTEVTRGTLVKTTVQDTKDREVETHRHDDI